MFVDGNCAACSSLDTLPLNSYVILTCLLWCPSFKVLAGVISAIKKVADRGGMGSTTIVRPSVYYSAMICCLLFLPVCGGGGSSHSLTTYWFITLLSLGLGGNGVEVH